MVSVTFESWTLRVLRLRRWVLVAWVAVLGCGAVAAVDLPGHLSNSFAVAGSDSDRARAILARSFGERPESTFTAVFATRGHIDANTRPRLQRRLRRAAALLPDGTVGDLQPGGGILYAELKTPASAQVAKSYTSRLRAALRDPSGPRAYLTGQPAIQRDLDPILATDLRRGTVIAVALALLVLLAVLGPTPAVFVPFVLAASTIAATFIAVDVIARVVPMVSYVRNVVELISLGLAVDFSLLVVLRFARNWSAASRSSERWCARWRQPGAPSSSPGCPSRSGWRCCRRFRCRSSARSGSRACSCRWPRSQRP